MPLTLETQDRVTRTAEAITKAASDKITDYLAGGCKADDLMLFLTEQLQSMSHLIRTEVLDEHPGETSADHPWLCQLGNYFLRATRGDLGEIGLQLVAECCERPVCDVEAGDTMDVLAHACMRHREVHHATP